MSNTSPMPVVVCGQTEHVAKGVVPGLLPEFEAVHICMGQEDAVAQVPLLLAGKEPVNPKCLLGSGNYAQPPQAIILGGAYTPEMVDEIRNAVRAVSGTRRAPFLQYDPKKGEGKPQPGSPEYPASVPPRIKAIMAEMQKQGGVFDGNDDGTYGW